VFQYEDHDVTAFSDLRVQFYYTARSFESVEDFFLEYSTNGGTTWAIVKQYVHGIDFQNGIAYFDSIDFSVALHGVLNLTTRARIRFRCDASGNGDYVYIDEVAFQGYAA